MNNQRITTITIGILLTFLSACAQLNQPPLCDSTITPINKIQSAAAISPLLNEQLTTRGIVTATWQAQNELQGFFIRSPQADDDQDPTTSEGLFIHTADTPHTVNVGDLVYVTGTVAETNQMTQLTALTQVAVCQQKQSFAYTEVQLPFTQQSDLEALEGMPIRLNQPLVVNGHYRLARHGQFTVAHERLYTPTQHLKPGAAAAERAAQNQLAQLIIDDNLSVANPTTIAQRLQLTASQPIRSGDTLAPLTGIINQQHDHYQLQPTSAIEISTSNPRPTALEPPATNTIRVAAFNVLNYFNGEGAEKTFPTKRGARNKQEFTRQHEKIIAALSQLNADIIGLLEIENDGYAPHSAIVELVTALRDVTGKPWDFIKPTSSKLGSDQITNGIIYRSDKVTPQGEAVTVNEYPFNTRSRPPLIQRFSPHNTVENIVVAVNHFKSKGSCPKNAADANADRGDGQGCWNQVRVQSAKLLADAIDAHPDLRRYPLRVLLGDFNAYAQEDPIQVLLERGYYNRIDAFDTQAYTYVFNAQAGSLDHILVSSNLAPRVVYQAVWHINADEPSVMQYQYATPDTPWYAPTPYRSSDHDPVYADIQF